MGWVRDDDLDGSTPAEQMTFGFDGKAYTLDLSADNKELLRLAMEPWLKVAAVYGELPTTDGLDIAKIKKQPGGKPGKKQKSSAEVEKNKLIREWANSNGWNLGSYGRLPIDVMDAYAKAHPPQE